MKAFLVAIFLMQLTLSFNPYMYRIAQKISNWKNQAFLFSQMFSFTRQKFHTVTAGIIVYNKNILLPILSLKITLRRHWITICILCKSTSYWLIRISFPPWAALTMHSLFTKQVKQRTCISRDLTAEQEQLPPDSHQQTSVLHRELP